MFERNMEAIKYIHSVHEFVNEIKLLDKALDNSKANNRLFFRGQRDAEWKVYPSIFRNGWLSEESDMYSKLLLSSPSDFSAQNTAYEKLTKMQHYGLPTRLLDVTSNPLVALYFACEESVTGKKYKKIWGDIPEAEQHMLSEDSAKIIEKAVIEEQPYGEVFVIADSPLEPDDDRITLLAELAHFCKDDNFTAEKLSMKIKPYVGEEMSSEQINQYLAEKAYRSVVSSMNNSRIKAQSGAFIIFGLIFDEEEKDLFILKKTPYDIKKQCITKIIEMRKEYLYSLKEGKLTLDEFESNASLEQSNQYIKSEYEKLPQRNHRKLFESPKKTPNELYSYVIPPECKSEILKELEQLGISHATLFPELEHQAQYIKQTTAVISHEEPIDIDIIMNNIQMKNEEAKQHETELADAKEAFSPLVTNKNTIISKALAQYLDNNEQKKAVSSINTDKQLFRQADWHIFPDKISQNRLSIKKSLRKIGIATKTSEDIAELIVNKMIQVETDKSKKMNKVGE